MRLHHLTVAAFGPFPGTEQIDFDELNSAGLFLLTGPTGAGKTSILDAICFALYGSVPGARGVKTLKSQHATADAQPVVVLDFSIRDRRFVLRRSPEWSRPKRRGEGTIAEKANATLIETTSGAEHMLSSRAQEVGHLISGLIGMNASQFVQVAMLPQGGFQRFLCATSQDRHDVLQHLFKTDRFARIEDWVQDHSRQLRERALTGESAAQRILDTMADRAGVQLPEELSGPALSTAAAAGKLLPWAEGLLTSAEALRVAARDHHDTTFAAVTTARARHSEETRVSAAIARRDEATSALIGLEAGQQDEDAARRELEEDSRAAGCRPILRLLEESVADHARSAAARLNALDSISNALPGVTDTDIAHDSVTAATLTALEQDLRSHITRLEILLPREETLATARRVLAEAEHEITSVRGQLTHAATRHQRIPKEREEVQARITRATVTSQRREVLTAELVAARKKVHAAGLLPEVHVSLERAGNESRDARDHAADARQRMQNVIARRLTGIAAELAGRLEAGEACQVCGSVDHPRPAQADADAVTEQEQEDANAAYDELNAKHELAGQRVAEVQRQVESLLQAADGMDAAQAVAREAEMVDGLAGAEAAETERRAAEKELARLTLELDEMTVGLHELQTRVATLEQSSTIHRQTVAMITDEITELIGVPDPTTTLTAMLTAHVEELAALEKAAGALVAHEQAASRVDQLTAQARVAAEEHGFASLDAVRGAKLTPERVSEYQSVLTERLDLRVRAHAVLDDAEVRAAVDREPADLVAAELVLEEAESTEGVAARALHHQEQIAESLRAHVSRLGLVVTKWAPARDDFVRAEAMSKLVRGMGGDNQLQMRLSAYVLATRLDQVVAAANERLAQMRDQRYLLERTGKSARKGAQAGLGLQVVDEWTGDVRDPATLSGGETFVVSLSLALGLADVVTQEAGGTDIDTLFVDEGFGMLDPDTLDDVMDRLDGLRAGGRTVGVVSHVSELRNRIPTQVHVEKRRTGSSITVRNLVA